MKNWHFWVILTCLCALCASCEHKAPAPELHQKVEAKAPVKFPPTPDFSNAIRKARPENGVYSTWGLIFNQDKLIDTKVRVRGKVIDVSKDCPQYTQPKGKRKRHRKTDEPEDKCLGISVMIQSPDDIRHPVRVVGYHPYYHPHLKPGMELDVTGKYVQHALVFNMLYIEPDNGLIIADTIHNMALSKNGRFTTDKAEVSRMRENGEIIPPKKH